MTQVVTPSPGGFLTHNRLTHSLKVAQVARSIAEMLIDGKNRSRLADLGGVDLDAVEAAALAHDIGHPPFGHIAEALLDEFAQNQLGLPDGFEGNAQSFRIVTRLEPRSNTINGLNLTHATCSAVLKYPWHRASKRDDHEQALERDGEYRLHWTKFGAYNADNEAFEIARSFLSSAMAGEQSIEAAIMDVADDITYAIHDLEDFYFAEMLDIKLARDALTRWISKGPNRPGYEPELENPFDQLHSKLAKTYPARFDRDLFFEAANNVQSHVHSLVVPPGHRQPRTGARHLVSNLITAFIGGITINTRPSIDIPSVVLEGNHWHQVQILKELIRRYVIHRTDIALVQRGQQVLLQELLTAVAAWCADPDEEKRLPERLREELAEFGQRAIVDYIAGLSDHQAIKLHRALTGNGPATPDLRFY